LNSIFPDKAHDPRRIPDEFRPLTGVTIGYAIDPNPQTSG
jgi:hypothetical protein